MTIATKRVAVLGQGYVGIPVAVRAAQVGFSVIGFDTNESKVGSLRSGRSTIDDIPDEVIAELLEQGSYVPTADLEALSGFDFAVIAVPTPLVDGAPDLTFVSDAARAIGPHISTGCCVILESTTYPGTTDEIVVPILEAISGLRAGADFHVGFSPERIDPGNTNWNFTNTPKVVSGLTEECLRQVDTFYRCLVDETVPVSSMQTAELTKLLENTYRHVNIALVNEMAIHASAVGIDLWEVVAAAATKPFGFSPFWPGPGVGGHCLPIDPSYWAWRVQQNTGLRSRFIDIANDINNSMPSRVVERITEILNDQERSVRGSRVSVIGVAYKKNCGDTRESPAWPIMRLLVEKGAEVLAVDPLVDEVVDKRLADLGVRVVSVPEFYETRTDLQVVLADHDAFDWDFIGGLGRSTLDTRHRLAGDGVRYL